MADPPLMAVICRPAPPGTWPGAASLWEIHSMLEGGNKVDPTPMVVSEIAMGHLALLAQSETLASKWIGSDAVPNPCRGHGLIVTPIGLEQGGAKY